MPGRLLVRRKGFTRKDGTRVKPSAYYISDMGKAGRGPQTIKIKREGYMTGFALRRGLLKPGQMVTDLPNSKIEQLALGIAQSQGPATALRMFQSQISFRARARGERLANRRKFEVGKAAIERRYFSQ